MNATERERNYVQARLPGREREFCYGLRYLSGPQLRRIRHKIHRRWRKEGQPS